MKKRKSKKLQQVKKSAKRPKKLGNKTAQRKVKMKKITKITKSRQPKQMSWENTQNLLATHRNERGEIGDRDFNHNHEDSYGTDSFPSQKHSNRGDRRDPVCGMEVASEEFTMDENGEHYVFCSRNCKEQFSKNKNYKNNL